MPSAAAHDVASRHPDAGAAGAKPGLVDLMIPVVKGWSTETGNAMSYLGVQVHGGMGFVEETGAAQFMRDARITTIYEGTTGIQANDLMGRKIAREGGLPRSRR
jgi:alkylation response protein AidB-like acyl-CoA dehydrogenase